MNMEMLNKKKHAVDLLSEVVKANQANVESVNYEVYGSDTIYTEFLVVNYVGGAVSIKVITGDSFSAIFRVLGNLLDSGYYEALDYYKHVKEIHKKII